jgi:hypothetical protein
MILSQSPCRSAVKDLVFVKATAYNMAAESAGCRRGMVNILKE